MSRGVLLGLSVVACVFGGISLVTDGSASGAAYAVNVTLAALLAVLTWQDLRRRAWSTVPAALIGLSYLLAPLLGLVLYALAGARPKRQPEVPAEA